MIAMNLAASSSKEARAYVPSGLGFLVFADGFESGFSSRWLDAWPPAGWAPGQKTQKFTFDRFGNLTKSETVGVEINNYPTSVSTNRMTSGATYDNRGNLTEFEGKTNSFDSLNRQWKRLNADGSADYFLYTADDERRGCPILC